MNIAECSIYVRGEGYRHRPCQSGDSDHSLEMCWSPGIQDPKIDLATTWALLLRTRPQRRRVDWTLTVSKKILVRGGMEWQRLCPW